MFTYFTRDETYKFYNIFREGRRRYIISCQPSVRPVYIRGGPLLCIYTRGYIYNIYIEKILFSIFLKYILYPAPKNTLFRN